MVVLPSTNPDTAWVTCPNLLLMLAIWYSTISLKHLLPRGRRNSLMADKLIIFRRLSWWTKGLLTWGVWWQRLSWWTYIQTKGQPMCPAVMVERIPCTPKTPRAENWAYLQWCSCLTLQILCARGTACVKVSLKIDFVIVEIISMKSITLVP